MNSVCIDPPSKLISQPRLIAVDFDPFADGELLLTAPATESQTEIWLSVQMGDAANRAANLSESLRLTGELDRSALEFALQQLVQRHESLRTTFSPHGETLCILASLKIEIPLIDLSALTVAARDAKLAQILNQDVNQAFDIVKGPLLSVQIIKLHACEHLLLLNVHHIICDGWSLAVLLEDLSKLYAAYHQGTIADLSAPEKFSDYAIAKAAAAQQPEGIEIEEYWLAQFADSVPVVDFPTDRPRPPLRTYDATCEYRDLAPELVSQLKQLGTKFGCSLVTTILAGFEVWLHRLTGQNDLIVGLPAAGQPAAGQDRLVGHCVNLLPLRTKIDSQASFAEYLKVRRATILDAYDHQEFTFGSLMSKLALPRDPSRIPLVPIIFNLDRAGDLLSFPGLEIASFTNPRDFGNFELFVNALEINGKIVLECRYNTNLFDAATIKRRLAELETLLSGIVAHPSQSIAKLPLLAAPEQQQLIVDWNATQATYPDAKCLHQLVEAQVKLTPQAIAVVYQDEQITYAELDRQANQLANYLVDLGVRTETFVGICVERSLKLVVGLLGILKAGGAYVPIDPNYPLDRIEYMLETAQIEVLLTQQPLVDHLPTQINQIVCLDTDWAKIAQTSAVTPLVNITAENIAYVIFTSGSTGKPKGVEVRHRGVVNFLTSMQQQPGIAATDILLSVTTLSFDIAVLEIFLPMTVGARVVLLSREDAMDGRKLAATIDRSAITIMQATPATWQLLLAAAWQGNQHLKILSGGEPITHDLAAQLLSKSAAVWNMYGPTETTIWSTIHQINADERRIPIGKPIANTQIYILDCQLQPLPIGIPGELYIGGDGLARGYLNRPDLNLERFIPNPFTASGKLYKTGDLARYLPDGNIECLGRIDNQVKVRGFRIELGEIETVISQHPIVREVRVIDREDRPGDKRLVGYVILQSQEYPTDSGSIVGRELQTFLRSKLPDYMIPSAFVMIDALPLTPNGKVDRQALPVPEYNRQESEDIFVAPRNELELQLTKIWERVLGVQSIGIRDNFFELGGHSLLAVKIFNEIEKTLNKNILLSTLFHAQTIEDLAEVFEHKESAKTWQSLVQIKTGSPTKAPLFCMHAIWGNILFYRNFAQYLETDRSVYGLQSKGLDGQYPLCTSIPEMAANYIQEIQRVQPQGPYLLTGFSLGGLIAFEVAQQLQAQGQEIQLLALLDPASPTLTTSDADINAVAQTSLLTKTVSHLRTMLKLSLKDQITYVWERLYWNLTVGHANMLRKAYLRYIKRSITELRLLDVFWANYLTQFSYIPKQYVGKVTLFKSTDPGIGGEDNSESEWKFLASDGVDIESMPGSHIEIMEEPNVTILCAKFSSYLAHEQEC